MENKDFDEIYEPSVEKTTNKKNSAGRIHQNECAGGVFCL